MDRQQLLDRFLPQTLRRRLRLALFRWRRVLVTVLACAAALLCSAAAAVLVTAGTPAGGDAAPSASASPTPSLRAGEVLLVVAVPVQEARHLEPGAAVSLMDLAARAGPPPAAPATGSASHGIPTGRLLWKSEPSGGTSAAVPLGLAVAEEDARRLAASARAGGLAVLQSGR